MCGSWRIMPRTSGVSISSTSRCILPRPRPVRIARWLLGRRIGEPIWRILIFLSAMVLLRHRGGFGLGSAIGCTSALDEVRHLLAATLRDRLGAGLLAERFEGGTDHVVGVRGAVRLGHHVGDTERFEHGAHRTTGDDAGTRGRRAQRDHAGTEMAEAIMVQRAAFAQRNANHRLLGSGGRLRNGFGHFARLAMTETGAALAVADDDERGETEALAALHGLRDTVDVDELFDQLFAAIIVARTPIVAATTAAAITTATIAARSAGAAATTAARRLGGGFGRRFGRCAFDVLYFVSHIRTPIRLREPR